MSYGAQTPSRHVRPNDGKDAHRLVRVNDATLTVWSEYGDGEPRMLDTDVAKRIGLKQSRNIRQMIERIWPEGQRPHVRTTVMRTQMPTGGTRETAGTDSQTVIEFDPKKTKREK